MKEDLPPGSDVRSVMDYYEETMRASNTLDFYDFVRLSVRLLRPTPRSWPRCGAATNSSWWTSSRTSGQQFELLRDVVGPYEEHQSSLRGSRSVAAGNSNSDFEEESEDSEDDFEDEVESSGDDAMLEDGSVTGRKQKQKQKQKQQQQQQRKEEKKKEKKEKQSSPRRVEGAGLPLSERVLPHHGGGDDDQSIYGFQGASIDNPTSSGDLRRLGPAPARSRPCAWCAWSRTTAAAATSCMPPTRWSTATPCARPRSFGRRGAAAVVAVTACCTAACEAALVVHEILKRHNRTAPAATSASSSLASSSSSGASSGSGAVAFRDMAVLFRTNATGAAFQEALRRHGVPFKTQADQLYNMLEIEDVLAFLRIVTNEADDRAFLRVQGPAVPHRRAVYGVLQQHQGRSACRCCTPCAGCRRRARPQHRRRQRLHAKAAAPPHKKPKLGSSRRFVVVVCEGQGGQRRRRRGGAGAKVPSGA